MTDFPPAVEQWRPLLAKYFAPATVDKFLYVINGESGGNPEAVGDGGAAYGLFQSHYLQPGATPAQQVQDAYRLYVSDLGNGGTGFGDWGEGRTYNGQPFGALGRAPYDQSQQQPSDSLTGQTIYRIYGNQNYSARRPPMPDNQSPADSAPTSMQSAAVKTIKAFTPPAAKGGSRKIYKRPSYIPTGNYAADMKGYYAARAAAEDAMDAYSQEIGAPIRINKDGTASKWLGYQYDKEPGSTTPVYGYTMDETTPGIINDPKTGLPVEGWVTDDYATQIATAITDWDKMAQRLDANSKIDSTATNAYLKAQQDQFGDQLKNTQDYYSTVKDLIAMRDAPAAQQLSLANALKAVNEANKSSPNGWARLMSPTGPEPAIDLSSAIKAAQARVNNPPAPVTPPTPGAYQATSGQQPVTPLPGAGSNGQKVPISNPFADPNSGVFTPGSAAGVQ